MIKPLQPSRTWIPLSRSIRTLFTTKQLMGISFILFLATGLLTWAGYEVSLSLIDHYTAPFFSHPPSQGTLTGWLTFASLKIMHWLYLLLSRTISFYLIFILAYAITCPGYVFLSTSAENLNTGQMWRSNDTLSLKTLRRDLLEGIKIGLLGLLISPLVLAINFIPVIGQLVGFLLYAYYSAIMFVDYPSSRRQWSLGKKIRWVRTHPWICLRLGFLPALISMVPLLNVFFIALLFPLLTIHTTLNFAAIEGSDQIGHDLVGKL